MLSAVVNKQIALVYKAVSLQPPKVRKADLLKEAGVAARATADGLVGISDVFLDAAGLVCQVKYLALAVIRA